jgi:hypothetical protein
MPIAVIAAPAAIVIQNSRLRNAMVPLELDVVIALVLIQRG